MWSGTIVARAQEDPSTTSREKQCIEGITTATSLSTFEGCDISTFCRQLRAFFSSMLQLSREIHALKRQSEVDSQNSSQLRQRHIFDISNSLAYCESITQYDGAVIERCLCGGIVTNLSALFQNHDSTVDRLDVSSSQPASRQCTALEEVINTLLDPTLVPVACASSVLLFLIKAYVEDTTLACSAAHKSDRPHLVVLEKGISILSHRSPQLSLWKLIVPYIRGILVLKLKFSSDSSGEKKVSINTDVLDAAIEKYNVDAAARCTSLLAFVQTLPHARLEDCALSLIIEGVMEMDNIDVLLMKMKQSTKKVALNTEAPKKYILSSCCSRCRMQPRRLDAWHVDPDEHDSCSRTRTPKTASVSDLHGGDMDEDERNDDGIIIESDSDDNGLAVERVRLSSQLRQYGTRKRVSMKRVMNSASDLSPTGDGIEPCACLCYTNTVAEDEYAIQNGAHQAHYAQARCTLLPIKMVQLRSNLYRALLSVAKRYVYGIPLLCRKTYMNTIALDKAIRVMKKYPICAASRLCAVMIADVKGIENGFLPLLGRLMKSARSAPYTSKDRNALRIYSELVVDLAFCDDPNMFWRVMSPLLDHALESRDTLQNKSTNEKGCDREKYILTMLRAISYIFVNRRRTLAAVDDSKVQAYVSKLSISFGCQTFWVYSTMLYDERVEIIHTLQALGILGFLGDESDEGSLSTCICTDVQYLDSLSGDSFPFPASSSLRDAVGRMGPRVGCNRFLSRLDASLPNDIPDQDNSKTNDIKERAGSLSEAAPILEYLNDDSTRNIFSYLSYRKLAKVTGVCKSWRCLGNASALWQQRYQSRFLTRRELDILPTSTSPSIRKKYVEEDKAREWRKLFDAKWKAERRLRSSFSRCGKYKHRTCNFVGCLAVLKSKAQYEKHAKKHQNDLVKKMSKEAASVARQKRKRELAKEHASRKKSKKVAKLTKKEGGGK